MNVTRAGKLDLTDVKFVEDLSDRRVTSGDVLFNNTNSPILVGKTAFVEVPDPLAYSNHMTRLRFPAQSVDAKFMALQLHHLWMTGFFERICSNHVNQASVATKRLLAVEVVLPPLDEQRRIVAILEDHLSRLDTASRSLETSSKLGNGLWASLVDRAFQSGESGGAAWPYVEVGSVAEFVRGVTYKKPEASSESGKDRVALLTASNIVNDSLDFATMIYVPMARVNSRQLCQAGDIVIATSSGSSSVVGKSALVRQDLQVTFGAFCGLLRPMPSVDARFLAHIVQSRVVRSSWSALARGTNINNLKAAQITTTVIPLPPMSTQRRLADMLDEARGHVARLEQQLSVAMASGNALRRSILQAAFSGQLSRESKSV